MAHPVLGFYLTYAFLGVIAKVPKLEFPSFVSQERVFLSANAGEEVTLECFYQGEVLARLYWYKQALGQRPQLISSFYKYDKKSNFYNEFKNNSRFTLDTENSRNHLKITDLHLSDSATYFCASGYTFIFQFAKGATLSVKGSGLNLQTLLHQSASKTIQPGASVTLNCTVHTKTCDGEHSVYWFKKSEQAHPGLIYTHGGRNDQCERGPDAQTHTCFYNLAISSLNESDLGTYYCVMAACGHLMFGNGTEVSFEGEVKRVFLVYFWIGASAFAFILCVLLTFSVCMINKRRCCPRQVPDANFSASSKKGYQNGDDLCYIVLREIKMNTSRRKKDETWSECVYLRVKQ